MGSGFSVSAQFEGARCVVEGSRIPSPPKAKYDVKVPPKKRGGDTFEVNFEKKSTDSRSYFRNLEVCINMP